VFPFSEKKIMICDCKNSLFHTFERIIYEIFYSTKFISDAAFSNLQKRIQKKIGFFFSQNIENFYSLIQEIIF